MVLICQPCVYSLFSAAPKLIKGQFTHSVSVGELVSICFGIHTHVVIRVILD